MKRLAAVFVGFFVGALTMVCATQRRNNESPLMAPYAPSRLEWLALDLESRFKTDLSGGAGISSVDFTAIAPDTVLVTILYTGDASAGVVDATGERAKDLARKDAVSYGWSKWLNIRVERHDMQTAQR